MKPEVQWYLAEALSNARGRVGARDDYAVKQSQLSHFAGALAAFRYVGQVTQDEEQVWYRRMLTALGYELPDPPPAGTAQAIYVGDPAKRPVRPPQPERAPMFIRSLPGPDTEFDVHGGRFRVIAVECYDSAVVVRWRASPEPDVGAAFPEETAALEQELLGLEEWAAEELRRKGQQRLRMMRLYKFDLTDDLGTRYFPIGSGRSGRVHEVTGEARFQPSAPEGVSLLVLSLFGIAMPIPIA